MQMLLAAALAGCGVAYGPSFVFGESILHKKLDVLMSDHSAADLAIYAVYPTRRHATLKLRRFVEHLSTSFGEMPAWDLMVQAGTLKAAR